VPEEDIVLAALEVAVLDDAVLDVAVLDAAVDPPVPARRRPDTPS
jgi:hypothetical protein